MVELRERTKRYALRVIRLYAALPQTAVAQILGKQLLRSATSVGARYRESQRARSDAEFLSKLEVALQELDESAFWIELLGDGDVLPKKRLAAIIQETNELIAIIAIIATCVRRVKERTRRKTEG